MPSVSKNQQKFMGIVRAIQKGDAPASKFSKKARDAAKSMKGKDVKKYASTKHKGLPNKVKSENKLFENPAAIAAGVRAAMARAKEKELSAGGGKKVKVKTALSNKSHPQHKQAKGIISKIKDRAKAMLSKAKKKKKEEPKKQSKSDANFYARQFGGTTEGFGGELKGSKKKKFERARKENAEQLGYKLTGKSDVNESVNENREIDKVYGDFEVLLRDFEKEFISLSAQAGRANDNKADERIMIKTLKKHLPPLYSMVRSWNRSTKRD